MEGDELSVTAEAKSCSWHQAKIRTRGCGGYGKRPHLQGISWSNVVIAHSNSLRHLAQPSTLIKLQISCEGNSESNSISFWCSPQQLQQLIFSLKEARRLAEQLAQH